MKLDDPVQYVKGVGPSAPSCLPRAGFGTVRGPSLPPTVSLRRSPNGRHRGACPGGHGCDPRRPHHGGERDSHTPRTAGRNVARSTVSRRERRHRSPLVSPRRLTSRNGSRPPSGGSCTGVSERSRHGGIQIVHPEIEPLEAGEDITHAARVLPVYQSPASCRRRHACDRAGRGSRARAALARSVVPEPVRRRLRLEPLEAALRAVHMPGPMRGRRARNVSPRPLTGR